MDWISLPLKNPILFWLIIIFCLVNLIDIVTAFFIKAGEGNPFYLLSKSMLMLTVFKILIIGLIIAEYRENIYPSNFFYYCLILMIILGILLFTLAFINNIRGIMNPTIVMESAKLSSSVKLNAYVKFVSFIYLIPLALSLLAFKLFEWSLKYTNLK